MKRFLRGLRPLAGVMAAAALPAYSSASADDFEAKIQPILAQHCYDCHGDGMAKGKVSLDEFKSREEMLAADELWLRVLKNVRAGLMPPEKKARLSPEEIQTLDTWIKRTAFGLDPAKPDPGRVTVRRLNRAEYRNTIRDLMGVEFNTDDAFPPDDTGYGFDNIGDVLTISPLLLEKYLQAAEKIVAEAVPSTARVAPEKTVPGKEFKGTPETNNVERMSFYNPAALAAATKVEIPGEYTVTLDFNVRGDFNFDPGRARVVFKINGQEKLREEHGWNNKRFELPFKETWEAGEQKFELELQPLSELAEKKTSVDLRLNGVKITGPLDAKHWKKTKNFERFFTRETAPGDEAGRTAYARELLQKFARDAFRRPADSERVDRLLRIAEITFKDQGKPFEEGIRQAMIAVLASPRFLYRVEGSTAPELPSAPIDEHALAARLSYFLWSTMPDEELARLADRGELRANLAGQVKRMLASERSRQFVNNFTGQWLQARDVAGISINERAVFARESDEPKPPPGERRRWRKPPPVELGGELRRAMAEETQEYFRHVMAEDRSVLEMIESDYTFVNEPLAKLYGIQGVEGKNMRRVTLPPESPRGGMITHGSVLVVTSNPTRTSPVKRGLFLLENFLGTPPPPPPAEVPDLEEAEKSFKDREPTLREALALHREQPLCSSCHNRMDPLGLAMENFNALGMWREKERGQKIDGAGKLITGEGFSGIREMKKILARDRKADFYRCLAEKMLTYALGRGTEYYDVDAVDRIVESLEKNEGRFSALLMGIVESAPFQNRRNAVAGAEAKSPARQVALQP